MFRAILNGVTLAAILMISAPYARAAGTGCDLPPESLGNFEATGKANAAWAVPFYMGDDTARTLADFRGRPVVVNFWATWCAPCVREMPALDRLSAEIADDGIRVLALSEDRGGAAIVERFYEENGIRHLSVTIDRGGKVVRALTTPGLPMTVLFDAEGGEIGRVVGVAEWDADETVSFLRRCLLPDGPLDSARR
jgi:thiol-disulfide isomerase/thioredoxin